MAIFELWNRQFDLVQTGGGEGNVAKEICTVKSGEWMKIYMLKTFKGNVCKSRKNILHRNQFPPSLHPPPSPHSHYGMGPSLRTDLKGPITWRISFRAECFFPITIYTAKLSPGWVLNLCTGISLATTNMITEFFFASVASSARAEILLRLHEQFQPVWPG